MLNYRHIFLIGHGRSGTTLLNGVIDSIPGIYMRGENDNALFHLHNAYRSARTAKETQSGPPHDITHPWHGAPQIEPDRFRDEVIASFIGNVLRPPEGFEAVGFKEVRHGPDHMTDKQYDSYTDFLMEAFERPCIIFNIRRISAILKSAFWPSIPNAAEYLAESERRFRRTMEKYPASTFAVSYDRYKRDHDTLRDLFAFLGANFDREALERVFAKKHSY